MSFLKKLFGLGAAGDETGPAATAKPEEHNGFVIRPAPYKEGGQYQTAGTIEKTVNGVAKEHRFIRAERHNTLEEAVSFTVLKARQIIDEQGERVFD